MVRIAGVALVAFLLIGFQASRVIASSTVPGSTPLFPQEHFERLWPLVPMENSHVPTPQEPLTVRARVKAIMKSTLNGMMSIPKALIWLVQAYVALVNAVLQPIILRIFRPALQLVAFCLTWLGREFAAPFVDLVSYLRLQYHGTIGMHPILRASDNPTLFVAHDIKVNLTASIGGKSICWVMIGLSTHVHVYCLVDGADPQQF